MPWQALGELLGRFLNYLRERAYIKWALDPRWYQPVIPPLPVERWAERDGVLSVGVPDGWRDLTGDELLRTSGLARARVVLGICATAPDPRLGCSATSFVVVDRGPRSATPDTDLMFVEPDEMVQARIRAVPNFSSFGEPWLIGLDAERAFVNHMIGSAPGERFGVEQSVPLMTAEVWAVHGETLYLGMFSSPTDTYESYLPHLWTMLGNWRWLPRHQ
jgi:hypothetical protein